MLWQAGNPVAAVDFHLSRPTEAHLLLNPLGQLRFDSADRMGGFILLRPADVVKAEYILQTVNHGQQTIQVIRRYKETTHQGHIRVAFWVQVS